MTENRQLAVFRVKAQDILQNYADRLKILVAENTAIGMTAEGIKAMKTNPASTWAREREKAVKELKHEVAALVNRIHIAAYTGRAL